MPDVFAKCTDWQGLGSHNLSFWGPKLNFVVEDASAQWAHDPKAA